VKYEHHHLYQGSSCIFCILIYKEIYTGLILCMVVSTPNAFIAASCARDGKRKTRQDIPTLKPVDVADVFGNSCIKRTVSKKPTDTHKVMEVYHMCYNM